MYEIKMDLTPSQEELAQVLIQRMADLAKSREVEKFRENLEDILNSAGFVEEKDYMIMTRYKAPDRIREKIARKNYESPDQMQDLAGLTVITKNSRSMTRVQRMILQNFPVSNIADYRNDAKRAYNGINMNLENVEVQIKDIQEHFLGFLDHDSIYKNPDISMRHRAELSKAFRKNVAEYIKKNNVELDFSSKSSVGIIHVLKATIREFFKVPQRMSVRRGLRTKKRRPYYCLGMPRNALTSEAKRKQMEQSAVRIGKKQL